MLNKSLASLLQGVPEFCRPQGALSALSISGITADSRCVEKGFLFVALPAASSAAVPLGAKAMPAGTDYIQSAIEAGAVAVMLQEAVPEIAEILAKANGVPVLQSANVRAALAHMAAAFYGDAPKQMVAVTGTNGKSSCVEFCRQLWAQRGHKAASLGTMGLAVAAAEGGVVLQELGLTTLGAVALQELLAQAAASGITHLAMEASSHGLDQYRLDGVRLKAAGFTNLSRDHLDYHGSMAAYFAAKQRLFGEILQGQSVAVLNADVPEYAALKSLAIARGQQVVSYGEAGETLRLQSITPYAGGQQISLMRGDKTYTIKIPLTGRFQIFNALCAFALAQAVDPDLDIQALSALRSVRGRMEYVGEKNGAAVYVDYAHTPDALSTVLQALRPHVTGRLHLVFGCGGNRDAGKRPLMGAIANAEADGVIITDDNPRHEDAGQIRAQILAACPKGEEIEDRKRAIAVAISRLCAGDALLLAGKGHETSQKIGDQLWPFDDAAIAKQFLQQGDAA